MRVTEITVCKKNVALDSIVQKSNGHGWINCHCDGPTGNGAIRSCLTNCTQAIQIKVKKAGWSV